MEGGVAARVDAPGAVVTTTTDIRMITGQLVMMADEATVGAAVDGAEEANADMRMQMTGLTNAPRGMTTRMTNHLM